MSPDRRGLAGLFDERPKPLRMVGPCPPGHQISVDDIRSVDERSARRLDIGFDWFNRKFDIEKKPLQSIGLVAGALVAVLYWAAVIVSRVVG